MKAIDVLTAAKNTFAAYGNEGYVKNKSSQFLMRCGARLEDGPNQPIDRDRVEEVVYAMLDADSEKLFWENLEGGSR